MQSPEKAVYNLPRIANKLSDVSPTARQLVANLEKLVEPSKTSRKVLVICYPSPDRFDAPNILETSISWFFFCFGYKI